MGMREGENSKKPQKNVLIPEYYVGVPTIIL